MLHSSLQRAYWAWLHGHATSEQATMVEAWLDSFGDDLEWHDTVDEIATDVVCAPAKRYDEFMQRFGVPSTAEEAEVVGGLQWTHEEEETAR